MKEFVFYRWGLGLGMIFMIWGVGCAGISHSAVRKPSRTGGVFMEMLVDRGGGSVVLYRVRRDGIFEFSGGLDARLGKVSWTGEMMDEEIVRMHELIDEMDWGQSAPESSHQPAELKYTIRFDGPGGRIRWKVEGENSRVQPMQDFLAGISERRLEEFMGGLPKPGVQGTRR